MAERKGARKMKTEDKKKLPDLLGEKREHELNRPNPVLRQKKNEISINLVVPTARKNRRKGMYDAEWQRTQMRENLDSDAVLCLRHVVSSI